MNFSNRTNILKEYHQKNAKVNDLSIIKFQEDDEIKINKIQLEIETLYDDLDNLAEKYFSTVPKVELSRCPHSGEVVLWNFDNQGLDGLWWDFEAPNRPENDLIKSFFAITGAVKLKGIVDAASHLCKPGPELPYVVPRLFTFPQIKAVISSIKIGNHTAYPILYFSDPMIYENRINDWAASSYSFQTPSGDVFWGEQDIESEQLDFDLKKYILSGKLLWIKPEDTKLLLRSTVNDCPYLKLEGNTDFQYIQDGKVWDSRTDMDNE